MPLKLCVTVLLTANIILGTEINDSADVNVKEKNIFPTFYDAIVFSDIADIINEFDKHGTSAFDVVLNSESESEDNIEDLLTEYNSYLEKAHKQIKSHNDKNRMKPKISSMRKEQTKNVPPQIIKYDSPYYLNNFYNRLKDMSQPLLNNNPIELILPMHERKSLVSNSDIMEMTNNSPKYLNGYGVQSFTPSRLDFPLAYHNQLNDVISSSCFCKSKDQPCDCGCKQCFVPIESEENKNLALPLNDIPDESLNIRLKIEIALPKIPELETILKNNSNRRPIIRVGNSKEMSGHDISVLLPFLHEQKPIEILGIKKTSTINVDNGQTQKMIIHKKKKSRPNNGKQRHRKKSITFHSIKFGMNSTPQPRNEEINSSRNDADTKNNTSKIIIINTAQKHKGLENKTFNGDIYISKTSEDKNNETQSEENIVSKTKPNDQKNNTENFENIIDPDSEDMKMNLTSMVEHSTTRKKRENNVTKESMNVSVVPLVTKIITETNDTRTTESDKNILIDSDLLSWPNQKNKPSAKVLNLTSIILEREQNKSKLNISKESIHLNHTSTIEQAIFGQVDWDDIDTIAPVFISFFGKYLRGVLTFCSETICHSMKCSEKMCNHRICTPIERLNQRGHCAGSNDTDSAASLESIMDLPSTIAFEIVDILQDRLKGKMYGKATICINTKCISFATAKKLFVKSKCSIKELNNAGHCATLKHKIN